MGSIIDGRLYNMVEWPIDKDGNVYGNEYEVRKLLINGANPNYDRGGSNTALDRAVNASHCQGGNGWLGGTVEVVKMMIDYGGDINRISPSVMRTLREATDFSGDHGRRAKDVLYLIENYESIRKRELEDNSVRIIQRRWRLISRDPYHPIGKRLIERSYPSEFA